MALNLSESVIRARLLEWRNLKKLHKAARLRVEALLGDNKSLKEKLAATEEEKAVLEEELRKRDETVEKLQKMLFERQAPRTRMQRPHEPKLRDAASYRRPAPAHIDVRRTISLKQCPDCHGSVSRPQSSRKR